MKMRESLDLVRLHGNNVDSVRGLMAKMIQDDVCDKAVAAPSRLESCSGSGRWQLDDSWGD